MLHGRCFININNHFINDIKIIAAIIYSTAILNRKLRVRPSKKSKPSIIPISSPLTSQDAYQSRNHFELSGSSSHQIPDARFAEAHLVYHVNTPPINKLPEELLLKVFELLTLRERINAELGNYSTVLVDIKYLFICPTALLLLALLLCDVILKIHCS